MKKIFCINLVLIFSVLYAANAEEVQAIKKMGEKQIEKVSEALNLASVLKKIDAEFQWDPLLKKGAFVKKGERVAFLLNEPYLVFSSTEALEVSPAYEKDGVLYFNNDFVEACSLYFAKPVVPDKKSKFTVAAIVIDAGHGGKDPGAVQTHTIQGKSFTVAEKDISLKTASYIEGLLRSRFPGKQIIMTRKDDTYPTLEERVEKANSLALKDNQAVIYLSIHANASFNKNADGYEVWYLSPDFRRRLIDTGNSESNDIELIKNSMIEEEFTTESIIIAKNILAGLEETVGAEAESRGIKPEEWFVVRNAKMPAVLIELGFITNPAEAAQLSKDAYLKKLAQGIYNGIVDFVGNFEDSRGYTE